MFGNFLEETATGTGATLALAGVTTGNIAFQEKFADGDLVAYVVEDSGGTIKVGGIGAYVSATDDITRDDTWNWNGTVYDDNPSTNITLSGGTHTVRCDVIGREMPVNTVYRSNVSGSYNLLRRQGDFGDSPPTVFTIVTTEIAHVKIRVPSGKSIDSVSFEVSTAQASSLTRVGICSIDANGQVLEVLGESASVDTSTTGKKVATFTDVFIDAEKDVFAWISSDSAVVVLGRNRQHGSCVKFEEVANFNYRMNGAQIVAVSSGQPAYPSPIDFNAEPVFTWPELLLRVV